MMERACSGLYRVFADPQALSGASLIDPSGSPVQPGLGGPSGRPPSGWSPHANDTGRGAAPACRTSPGCAWRPDGPVCAPHLACAHARARRSLADLPRSNPRLPGGVRGERKGSGGVGCLIQLQAHEGIRLVADHTAHAAHDGVSERRVAPVAAVGIGALAVRWRGMPPARVPSASLAGEGRV